MANVSTQLQAQFETHGDFTQNVDLFNSPPRLFLNTSRIRELQAAIQLPGSHHQAAFNAMKARVDPDNWQVYDEDPSDGNHNYARAWLAREAALMYLLTADPAYAQQAYRALSDIDTQSDPDGRSMVSGSGLSRAMVGMNVAIAYDWAGSGWTPPQRQNIHRQLLAALDAWPDFSHPNLAAPWGSNWVAVTRGAELVMLLATAEETNRADRYELLKSQLQQHLETAYGPTGWTQEGNGYLAYGGSFLLPAVLALRDIGDVSLEATVNAIDFWRLPLYAGAFDAAQSSLQFGVGYPGFDNEGWTSLLLGLTPTSDLPYYQYFYDHHRGIDNAADPNFRFDNRRAGTTWSLIYYPTDTVAANPTDRFTPVLADEDKGAYFFRNRWQDENDVLVSFMGDFEWHPRAWDQQETGYLGLFAYDTQFIGGPEKQTTPLDFSYLLVDGVPATRERTGTGDFFEARSAGGYVIVDGSSPLAIDSAQRHLLVDFSGNAGAAVLSTLDRIQDTDSHQYTWQLNLGNAESDGDIRATTSNDHGIPTFLLTGKHNSYVKGWVLGSTPVTLTVGDPLQISTVDRTTTLDIWVVMVVGSGPPPTASITGTGLNSELRLANTRLYFDANRNQIVAESSF